MNRTNSNSKVLRKQRETRPYIGDIAPVYNSTSSYMPTPINPEWNNRLNADYSMAMYKSARQNARSLATVADVYGYEELVERRFSRGGMNNVTHFHVGIVNKPFGMMWTPAWGGVYIHDYNRVSTTRGYALGLKQHVQGLAHRFQPGNDSQFSARAFWSMRPKFQGEVSIINSIFELKDFRDVLKPLQIARSFKRAVASPLFSDYKRSFHKLAKDRNIRAKLDEYGIATYKDLNPETLQQFSRSLSGSAATAVLTMSLAVKPTIADALAIMAQYKVDAMDAQRAFAASGDDGSLSHYGETSYVINSLVRGTRAYDCYGTGSFSTIKRTATMRSFYEYKMRDLNETLVKYWGLAGTTDALWNMLPLSFVLDYVFTVGKALQFMTRDNNVTNLTTEYCESVSILSGDGIAIWQDPRIRSLIIDGEYIRPRTGPVYHLVSGTECKRYTRKVMEPYKGPALPVFKVPKTSQAVNLLALARCILF